MDERKTRIGLLLIAIVFMSVFCIKAVYGQVTYRGVQEETNRVELVKEQVKMENLTDRVAYQESVHADIRLAKMENTADNLMKFLVALCGGVGMLLIETTLRLTRKKETD